MTPVWNQIRGNDRSVKSLIPIRPVLSLKPAPHFLTLTGE